MAADLVSDIQRYREYTRQQSQVALGLTLALSAAALTLLFAFPAGPHAILLVAAVGFVVLSWYLPVVSVSAILGMTILFEQYDFALFKPITRRIPFFENASAITGIKGIEASPLEILLVIVTLLVLARIGLKRLSARPNPIAIPVVSFGAAALMWVGYGLLSGGKLSVALWELRALAYFMLLTLLVPTVITSLGHVRLLLWVAILAVGVKAAQGIWNYVVVLNRDMTGVRSVTGHEDALFIAWMGVLLLAFLLYRTGGGQKRALVALTPVLGAAFVYTDRRAAYVAFVLGALVLAALAWTDRSKRAAVVKAAVPLLLAGILVVAAGWNSDGFIGRPAETIRSIGAPESKEDIDSSYYRRQEEVNLIHAVERNPVLGLGFGRAFQEAGQGGIVDVGFSLENYIPHNEIMWVWSKMGTFGFALFWMLMGSVIVMGGVVVRQARDPYIEAVAALVSSAMAMQIVVSYVDLQLTYARNMVFLGVLAGIVAALPSLSGGEVTDVQSR